jgi:hypothetical protein
MKHAKWWSLFQVNVMEWSIMKQEIAKKGNTAG